MDTTIQHANIKSPVLFFGKGESDISHVYISMVIISLYIRSRTSYKTKNIGYKKNKIMRLPRLRDSKIRW